MTYFIQIFYVDGWFILQIIELHPFCLTERCEVNNKMKNKQYHTVRTAPKYNSKIVERGKIGTPSTHIHFPDLVQALQ